MIEKVSPFHPDKCADRIAGAVVDQAYRLQENPKVACEVLLGHGHACVMIESSVVFDKDDIKRIVERIAGITDTDILLERQDPHLAKNQQDAIRCGDNGIFKGMPLTEEEKKMSKIAHAIYSLFPSDGKYILDGEKLIICQSRAMEEDLRKLYPKAIINPLGYWIGGPDVDCGCTNRKLGSDMGHSVTGGGLCVSGDTEYLGEDLKWHPIKDYHQGKVGQWNDGVLEFVEPLQYIHNENDTLIHFHNDSKLSMRLTPNHNVLVRTSKGNYIKHKAEYVAEKLMSQQCNMGHIPHSFTFQNEHQESKYRNENELRLQVAFCADGTLKDGNRWTGRIRVKKEHKKERLRLLLQEIDHKESQDGEFSIFWISPALASKSLYECFAGEDLSIVYDELFWWDGDAERHVFRTTKKEDADFAQFVIASQGKVATITEDDRIGEQYKQYTRKSTLYTVSELKSVTTALRSKDNGKGFIHVDKMEGLHDSYCFEVPSHNLILRSDKRIFITGNCGKDLSKADVSVNIYAFVKAQMTGKPVELCCAIGDETIDGRPYKDIVDVARLFINKIGGFEKFAEWGLF